MAEERAADEELTKVAEESKVAEEPTVTDSADLVGMTVVAVMAK